MLVKLLVAAVEDISVCWVWSSLRIQKPREVMFAPPVLVMLPVRTTDVPVKVPLDIVRVGAVTGTRGCADVLAHVPAPAWFTALTLKLCVVLDRLLKVWLMAVMPCTVIHAPLFRDTSYL